MPSQTPWWRRTVVYQIYPRSFADSNGDGIGDLEGIIGKLDYLAELGVETLWLSPFYASPQADVGYDISDYRAVAPEYGEMATVDRLIAEAHARGLRIVLDMVLNHTSDQHPWFLESRSSRDSPKRDFYIWRDGRRPGGGAPPNNWHAMIGGSGWQYDETTDQWYWTQFLPFQPDLNYRNPQVQEAMLDTMRFWLDRGVDGFRLDIVNALFEDEALRDNPFTWNVLPSDDDPAMFFQTSERTLNHPDTLAFMKVLRRTVDAYDDPPRFMVGEVNASIEMARAHCATGDQADGLHLAFLFKSLTVKLEARALRELLALYEREFSEPLLPTWVFGNHDRARRISRLGGDLERAKLNAALQLTARGVPFLYNGEEIGMQQQRIPARQSQDPLALRMKWLPQVVFDAVRTIAHESINRDESRTPMHWSAGPHAGFCPAEAEPWLPVAPWHERAGRNVETQLRDPGSLLRCYQRFLRARRETPALNSGGFELLPEAVTGRSVVGYRRCAQSGDCAQQVVTVLLNCSPRLVSLAHPAPGARLLVSTVTARDGASGRDLALLPWEGLVLLEG